MINYFPMQNDVATGAEACYPGVLPPTGTDASFTPEGYEPGKGMARGHLIAKELGGSGSDGRNIVALYPGQGKFQRNLARCGEGCSPVGSE
ncbi:hypothetical protein AB0M36_37340 [Actinoplanes sp. NPDC051346]|uniref:hypothetical protein n=1 Tax=Actinoplanes sp. NPDC051346 TaxID=3155048 RepID=UPI0034359D02